MEVEQVYNNIAKEFSNSRYRVWSGVKKFLDLLPINTTNGDIGCGNGKNMMYRTDISFTGYDISDELIKICLERNLNVHKGNILNLPITDNYFDNTISIAVIHHLEKQEDRIKALSELLRITKPRGKILVYVWSFLQDNTSYHKFTQQDTFVSFKNKDGIVFNRFYHLYVEGELEYEINTLKSIYNFTIESYNEKNNWYCIINKLN